MVSLVVGLGKTGASCVRYLSKRGIKVCVTDSRSQPPGLAELGDLTQQMDIRLGGFDLSLLDGVSQVLMSPGVALDEPIVRRARELKLEVIGDIELFARAATAPVVGITGTNGKSTVTSLVASMAQAAGRRVLAGGNLGKPALDLLEQTAADLYVLELSSFQLETTYSLHLVGAAVLNVTPDHMDRYPSEAAYAAAKARVFNHATTQVLNADDPWVVAMRQKSVPSLTFSIQGAEADFTLLRKSTQIFLARHGEPVLDMTRMKISGLHNAANALAALALGEAVGLPLAAMITALESFPGLAHRSEFVADIAGVRYVDDSKGTNVGATLAAVAGLVGPLVMIAGGEGKGQDFTPLRTAFAGKVRAVVLIGKDAPALAQILENLVPIVMAQTMLEAVRLAADFAKVGDTVLLSPACASLDMFRDYSHRGQVFAAAVRHLPHTRVAGEQA